jgi:hypothetical protein
MLCFVVDTKECTKLVVFFFGSFFGFFGNEWEFMINWPTLISLWQAILVIPTSSALVSVVFLIIIGLRAKGELDSTLTHYML